MTKNSFSRIVLIFSSVLIIAGVSLLAWVQATSENRNVINVRVQEGKTESFEFDNLNLIPGESCEYVINLKRDSMKKYDLSLDFVEIGNKSLKNFAYVKIISNGDVVCDKLLATVFEDQDVVLPVDFNEGKNTEITIVYYLPIDVGNEAKNAEAAFELLLTASNE